MKWLKRSQPPKPIALSITLAAMLLLAAVSYLSAETASTDMTPEQEQQYNDAKQSAGSLGNDARQHFGTESGIQQNINAPMTSGNAEMETLDGSRSFTAQLTSPSSSKFLTIIIQPGSGGDITSVRIMQDTDMDDEADYDFMLPFSVSGVCGNGLISCDTGTWNNCRYYKWDVDDNDKLILEEGDFGGRLGGCYCVNNSCGSNLVWNNLQSVLGSLGGGASGAMMNRHPHYVITKVEIDGPSITYYGQNPDNVSQTASSYGNSSPEQFYQGDLDGAAENEAVTQSGDPDSYYTLLSNAFDTQDGVDIVSCVTKNDLSVITEIGKHGGGTIQIESTCDNFHEMYLDGTSIWANGDWPTRSSGTFNLPDGRHVVAAYAYNYDGSSPAGLIISVKDARGRILHNTQGSGDWKYTKTDPGAGWANPDFDDSNWSNMTRTNDFGYAPWGTIGGWQDSTADWIWWHSSALNGSTGEPIWVRSIIPFATDSVILTTNGQCDLDSSCRLRGEKICDDSGMNCIQTWHNFNPTGLKPFPICKQITSDIEVYTACMDGCNVTLAKNDGSVELVGSDDTNSMWWWIERTYKCDTDRKFDFTSEKERVESVTGTLRDDTSSLYYRDYRKDENGNWGYMDTTVALFGRDISEVCEKACKLRKVKENTQAGTMGTTAQNRTTILSYEYVYKACTDGVCPVAEGEEVIKSCQCISDFAEAATVMSAVNSASHDLICSDGVKK